MRKVQQWVESASIQEEKGCKIKRYGGRMEIIQQPNPKKWLGQPLSEAISINRLEEQVDKRIDILIDMKDDLNERKVIIQKKIKAMATIEEGERE